MKRAKTIKKWLLIGGLFLITYPLFEYSTQLNISGNVHGATLNESVLPLSKSSWFNGTFQESVLNYMNDQIGLFPFFVRVHNELEYRLFGNIYTQDVLKGKNNFLFEQGYIDSYYGEDFLGPKRINRASDLIISLQDTLQSMGKFMMVCLATGKGTYYPEYLPYKKEIGPTNHEYFVKAFGQRGINYFNTLPWFLEMKDTLGHLLFPQYGIHWSHYSTVLVTDSLVKYIEANTGWDLPNLKINKRNYSNTTKYFDNDIAYSMNLFGKLEPDEPMIYPDFEWTSPEKKKKKLLVIGDSFFWDIFENVRIQECFEEVQFWYYSQIVVKETEAQGRDDTRLAYLSRHLNMYEILKEYDAFLILTNEPNAVFRGWGFPKDGLYTLRDSNYVREERSNAFLRDEFLRKKGWRDDLAEQAKKRKISTDSMLSIYLHDPNFKFQ